MLNKKDAEVVENTNAKFKENYDVSEFEKKIQAQPNLKNFEKPVQKLDFIA